LPPVARTSQSCRKAQLSSPQSAEVGSDRRRLSLSDNAHAPTTVRARRARFARTLPPRLHETRSNYESSGSLTATAMVTLSRSARITLLLVIDVLFFFVELIIGLGPHAHERVPILNT
jgi:hypothetical protein